MTKYKCECGKTKELSKSTLAYINGKWETREALCSCGKFMDSKVERGIPALIRTEDSLRRRG
tara:strand:+ start:107 stop:292 length:186 start_codon:yes stop_codon:yes gene_type:complete